MELRNARILITGGTTGVGAALVGALHQAESIVVTSGRDRDRCATLRSRHPGVHVVEIAKMSPEAVAGRIVNAIVRSKRTVYVGKARLLPWLVRLAPSVGRRAPRDG